MPLMRVERDVSLPDDLRVARATSAPHLGPRILFFSGGSALNGISRKLKWYTYNSIHLITPFDSGGSSQVLRAAFDMPAVGDLRSRLMALADETVLGQPEIFQLFIHRLPKTGDPEALQREVAQIFDGTHPLISAVSRPMRRLIQSLLSRFADHVPKDFDYRNASIGNLILAGGYLNNGRELEPVLFLMSKMVDVRGTVRTVIDENLQLGVDLENGQRIIGQKKISGKESPPINSPIAHCFLSDGTNEIAPQDVALPTRNRRLIALADVICYPPGSLYSSVIANLLPAGVGKAIAARRVPKVYVPSLGPDPEAFGHNLCDQVSAILAPLRRDVGTGPAQNQLLTHVLCDLSVSDDQCQQVTERHGIPCHRMALSQGDQPKYDPVKIAEILISLG